MCRVLIIEDSYSVRESIWDALELKQYELMAAENGLQAMILCRDKLPDIIISDIMMPYMDGFEVLDAFQKNPATSSIPFIFLSAKSSVDDVRFAMNSGADDYLTKPFKIRDLLEAVESRLKKKRRIEDLIKQIMGNLSQYMPHELRTPLVPIIGYSDILLNELEKIEHEDIRQMLQGIKFSGTRLHKTIEKFLFLSELSMYSDGSHSNNNEKDSECSIITLSLIQELAGNVIDHFNRAEDVKFNLEPGQVNIRKQYLGKIIEEVLENAFVFSKPGTPVEIKGYTEDKSYKLTILDHGSGFSKEELSSVQRMIHNGSGLGLVIVHKIIQMYKGSFKLKSEKDQFTSVTITLPGGNNVL